MKTLPTSEILSRSSLFENISVSSMQALADICLPKNLKKKERLFIEGDKAFFLYVLVTGGMRLYKTSPDGRDVVIKVVKPGEMFAEAILFESDRYPVSAVAVATSYVYQIPKHQFNCLLEKADFRNDFLRNLMLKLRFLAEQIQHLTLHDAEERLRLFIRQQYGRSGQVFANMSKKDMASAIGAAPETFSRLLQRLNKEDKLSWVGGAIKISDSFLNPEFIP
jgi:CRP/FNR family transcriptional regulator